ncbi:BRO family protein [Paratractidigestivibacter faecalis]|uniref:BRO family protein n=1 Tax=Paratractidigestivibacter faecalis TaxID=2292441 RepID=UPI003AB4F6D5
MNEIQSFDSPEFGTVRALRGEDGEPLFVARDVTDALGLDRTATRRLDEDEKGVHSTHTPGGNQQVLLVTEPGFYKLVLQSRKPEAKAFQRWVTHEVLPALRREGAYEVPGEEPLDLVIARGMVAANKKIQLLEDRNDALRKQAEELRPKAAFFDRCMESDALISVRDAAKMLKSFDRDMGEKRLRELLRERGYVEKRTLRATAEAIRWGYMVERTFTVRGKDGDRLEHYGVLTPKGVAMCMRRFCRQPTLPGSWQ